MHAVVPPIHPSVAYARTSDGRYPGGHSYTRDQNPTYDQVEALLARLDGGTEALLFGSGMAAATTIFETLEPGAHVVVPTMMYWTLRLWLRDLAERGRIMLDEIPNDDLDALRTAMQPGRTAVVWIETPSNPMGVITDIAAASEIAHAAGALVVADNTLATPVLCQPLALGVDLVMHSATKQLNGHTDVLAGALVTARTDPHWERIRFERAYRGAVLGPFEAWLLQRGLRTLYLRVGASARAAQQIADVLAAHPAVAQVFYPGLSGHPGHAIAARQMAGGFGSVVSFRPRGGRAAAQMTAGALRVFRQATSFGGVESLVERRASVEGEGTPVPDDLLRLSIGIEDPADLVADLERALAKERP